MAFYRRSRSGIIPESGAIFMSNRSTKDECFTRRLLGLPLAFADFVKHVRVGMMLFLFEHERRELYGVFEAVSDGSIDIVPDAYQSSGKKFPAQVRFDVVWKCHPIPESSFRDAIRKNYFGAYKFNFGLCGEQVLRLLCLFDSQRVVPHRTLVNRLHPRFPKKQSLDNEPEVTMALKMPDDSLSVSFEGTQPDAQSAILDVNEQEGLDNNMKNTDVLPALSDTIDEYIPLSSSYSSDSEGNLYENEPRIAAKGLYSDNLVRKSVFSRLKLPLEAAASKERKYKANTADENSVEVTMIDPVPRLKWKISEGNGSVEGDYEKRSNFKYRGR